MALGNSYVVIIELNRSSMEVLCYFSVDIEEDPGLVFLDQRQNSLSPKKSKTQ